MNWKANETIGTRLGFKKKKTAHVRDKPTGEFNICQTLDLFGMARSATRCLLRLRTAESGHSADAGHAGSITYKIKLQLIPLSSLTENTEQVEGEEWVGAEPRCENCWGTDRGTRREGGWGGCWMPRGRHVKDVSGMGEGCETGSWWAVQVDLTRV